MYSVHIIISVTQNHIKKNDRRNEYKKYIEKMKESKIPDEVSWRVVDAWKAIPPCNYKEDPYCHVQCPYFYECNPEPDEEEWP